MNTIEVDGQEIEKHEYILHDLDRALGEQEPRCSIDIQGISHITGKTKALIVIMPHYDNDIPTVINIGLDNDGIEQAINIADGAFRDIDTYKKESERLQKEVDRLETELEYIKGGYCYA